MRLDSACLRRAMLRRGAERRKPSTHPAEVMTPSNDYIGAVYHRMQSFQADALPAFRADPEPGLSGRAEDHGIDECADFLVRAFCGLLLQL